MKQIKPSGPTCVQLISSSHNVLRRQLRNDYGRYATMGLVQDPARVPLLVFVMSRNKLEYMCADRHTATSAACTQWTAPPQWNIIHWYSGQRRQNGCCMGSGVGKNAVLWQKPWRAVRLNNVGNRSQRSPQSLDDNQQFDCQASNHNFYPQSLCVCVKISNAGKHQPEWVQVSDN